MKYILRIFILLIMIVSINCAKVNNDFLPQKIALQYYNNGKILQCGIDSKRLIITKTTYYVYTIVDTYIFRSDRLNVSTMATHCNLYNK